MLLIYSPTTILSVSVTVWFQCGVYVENSKLYSEMVLSEKEKNGALKILSLLSDTEVVSLAKTVTKGHIIIGTREGKMEAVGVIFRP